VTHAGTFADFLCLLVSIDDMVFKNAVHPLHCDYLFIYLLVELGLNSGHCDYLKVQKVVFLNATLHDSHLTGMSVVYAGFCCSYYICFSLL
jgi:hypothetical protein